MRRSRLDAELLRRELVSSLDEARQRIADCRVLVGGAVATKETRLVSAADPVVVLPPAARFVSRGGEKLDAALESFGLSVLGRRVLDAGASTGGFTDCLLQRGAAQVVAVDVGHGQLHPRIRADGRVVVLEHVHVRDLSLEAIGGPVSLVVADLSFISLRSVLGALLRVCQPEPPFVAEAVLLVKPQFEATDEEVSRGRGVITDPLIHRRVRHEIDQAIVDLGSTALGWIDSPLTGGHGNLEMLVHVGLGRTGCEP